MSPYALTWDNQNYYLVAFDSIAGIIKHFRVDKMSDISMIDEPRDGQEAYKILDMAQYSKSIFGMFSGEPEPVRLRFSNQLVGSVLDRLGHDIMLIPDGEDHFTVTADVVVSPQFFAWVFGFGDMVQILGPQSVIDRMVSQTETVLSAYTARE
jgi:predicted DNA-binding transcriptional regulator YafY